MNKDIELQINDIGGINLSLDVEVKKLEPPLSNLSVTPGRETQVFTPDETYGFDTVIVNGDENLLSDNIKEGVSVFGVQGTITPSVQPKKGFKINEWDEDGYIKDVSVFGFDTLPSNYLYNTAGSIFRKTHMIRIEEGVTGIGSASLANTVPSGGILQLPETLTTLSENAFNSSTYLKRLSIPKGVTEIPNYAFRNCSALVAISLPGVKSIYAPNSSNNAFYGASNLRAVWLGDNVTSSGLSKYVFNQDNICYIFIDLPRETVKTFTNYNTGFQSATTYNGIQNRVICNDDSNFITLNEFEQEDWSRYYKLLIETSKSISGVKCVVKNSKGDEILRQYYRSSTTVQSWYIVEDGETYTIEVSAPGYKTITDTKTITGANISTNYVSMSKVE